MREAALLFASFIVSWLGLALLAMSQARHCKTTAVTRAPSPRRLAIQRSAGALMLPVALVLTWLRDGPSFGTVLWLLLLSLAAMTVTFVLSWQPQWLKPFGRLLRRQRPGARLAGEKVEA